MLESLRPLTPEKVEGWGRRPYFCLNICHEAILLLPGASADIGLPDEQRHAYRLFSDLESMAPLVPRLRRSGGTTTSPLCSSTYSRARRLRTLLHKGRRKPRGTRILMVAISDAGQLTRISATPPLPV